ncbi:TPM domain-containing protein [Niabella sp. CC-SYL272]|uniref:TPM domain-containing protein n=1 Tax=Niabella agricola TaxID=2891571 RepID=UPI001F327244|nr:TPM domain-containing protein [Niabella agricola]MCF3111187.1 TPM domain-containing protein [Niabella agricola]
MTHLFRPLPALFVLLLLQICMPITAQRKWTVKEVPDPKRTPSFNYVSNPDGILSNNTVAAINGHLKRLEDSTTDQVAVVVLQSIGKKVPRDFAMELLRYWGVGRKDKNNGVVMLLVMDQRRMEFEVGYGLEGKLTDLVSKQIQEEYMVPFAKQGNYDAAVLNGVQQVAGMLSGAVEVDSYTEAVPADAAFPAEASEPSYGNTSGSGGLINLYQKHVGWGGFWVLLFYAFFFVAGLIALFKKKVHDQFFDKASPWWFLLLRFLVCYVLLPVMVFVIAGVPVNIFTGVAFFYVLALAATGITVFRLLGQLRREEQRGTEDDVMYFYARQLDQRWKKSLANKLLPFPLLYYREQVGQYLDRLKAGMVISDTGNEMRLLDEKQDNAYLTEAQKMEEQLKSVDYDVWAEKQGKAFKLHGVLLSSKYSHCPKCNTMAYFLESDRTIEPATYSSSGVGLKVYACKFCHYQETKEYAIPRKSQSSSGSSSGSSWSSGSSSSGSSWGGGSSGGGGAGSSW